MNSSWTILILAGLLETAFAVCLGKARMSSGNAAIGWYAAFVVFLILSMVLLVKATERLPIGTAYAVWTGIGALGTVVIGILWLKEPVTFWRLFFLTTLIASVIGLKYTAPPSGTSSGGEIHQEIP